MSTATTMTNGPVTFWKNGTAPKPPVMLEVSEAEKTHWIEKLGGAEMFAHYQKLIEMPGTNKEKPGILEKRYVERANEIARWAGEVLACPKESELEGIIKAGTGVVQWQDGDYVGKIEIYDPRKDPASGTKFELPRPNVIVEYGPKKAELIGTSLAHFDQMPVDGQDWHVSPHKVTWYKDDEGKIHLCGRGVADDLSGVFETMTTMKHVKETKPCGVMFRGMLVCDEETGGAGGFEPLLKRYTRICETDEGAFKKGDKVFDTDFFWNPDASFEILAGSSGIVKSDAKFKDAQLADVVKMLEMAFRYQKTCEQTVSNVYPPIPGSPYPMMVNRISPTILDFTADYEASKDLGDVVLVNAHAVTEAYNTVPSETELTFRFKTKQAYDEFVRLMNQTEVLFKLPNKNRKGEEVPVGITVGEASKMSDGSLEATVVAHGAGGHAGYTYNWLNSNEVTLSLLSTVIDRYGMYGSYSVTGRIGIDMRLIPELDPAIAKAEYMEKYGGEVQTLGGTLEFVGGKRGFCIPRDCPDVKILANAWERVMGTPPNVAGEDGGLDTSALEGYKNRKGQSLTAVAFGPMSAYKGKIHAADENLVVNELAVIQGMMNEAIDAYGAKNALMAAAA